MRRPRSFMPTANTSTRSLCISVAVSARANQGSRAIIRQHQHIAVARPRTRPATRSPSPAVAKPFGPSMAWPSRTMAARRFARRRAACRCRAEALGQARRGQRLLGLGQVLEEQFAARDGFRVAGFLELEIGVLAAPIGGLAGVASVDLGPREPLGPRRVIGYRSLT
jgi:hypothetical protein